MKLGALAGFVWACLAWSMPPQLPGEGLAVAGRDGVIHGSGDSSREQPMGSLAKLVWLRLEGDEWAARHVTFHCTGSLGTWHCWNQEGHGTVDLAKATEVSCNLAFLSWILESSERWQRTTGTGAARTRLEEAFSPFLGQRLMPGEGLPSFSPEWVGDGQLLCTTPERMLAWLIHPAQAGLVARCRHTLTLPGSLWWMKTGTSPVPGARGATSAWVVGGDGNCMAVLHLPRGRGKAEGIDRFRALMEVPEQPQFTGDPEGEQLLAQALGAAMASTSAYGPWPSGHWEVRLHGTPEQFEAATGAPRARAACWVGLVLHLRPRDELRRRDLGRVLRHEVVHGRLRNSRLRPWEEEARTLHAEEHSRPPALWPSPPTPPIQQRLDRALKQGTTREQAWAYQALRAWISGKPLPVPPGGDAPKENSETWKEDPPAEPIVRVIWPPERLPMSLEVNGNVLTPTLGKTWHFEKVVRFGKASPIRRLDGLVDIQWTGEGWQIMWTLPPREWVAAATAGELGDDAPFEAKRALAAVISRWLDGHPEGNHPGGSLCPLTHCAVVRGNPSASTREASALAPPFTIPTDAALFCGSKGGVSMSPYQVWGQGVAKAPVVPKVPGDRWADWTRHLRPDQVQFLKSSVKPGLKGGQEGLYLGASGPYPVEDLRIATGRAYGWTLWPSNACKATTLPDGGLELHGHGWGHNVGLCLSTAIHRAKQGGSAESILSEAFGQ